MKGNENNKENRTRLYTEPSVFTAARTSGGGGGECDAGEGRVPSGGFREGAAAAGISAAGLGGGLGGDLRGFGGGDFGSPGGLDTAARGRNGFLLKIYTIIHTY